MSAVPKKKLCWNCEGNVARDVDNCPYCGVYLHVMEDHEDNSTWNPPYHPAFKKEEIPSPLYQIKPEIEEVSDSEEASLEEEPHHSFIWKALLKQIKRDIFPILFLMMGSIFFLFGVVIILFSQNGTFTLQWQESDGLYFLLFAAPLIAFGWKFFQEIDD